MTAHAKFSPSAAHRWVKCPGSMVLEQDIPRRSSDFADEGTAAHELGERTLLSESKNTLQFLGQKAENGWLFSEDMCENVQIYVNNIMDYANGATLLVEERVNFSKYIGQESAFGTSDAVILRDDLLMPNELQVHDLKYGMGVEVYADNNEQLMLYALGALEKFSILGDFAHVRMVIHQPRRNHLSEWDCTAEEIFEFGRKVKAAAEMCVKAADAKNIEEFLNPGEKQCQWCSAKGKCPALAKAVLRTVADDFDNLEELDIAEVKVKETLTNMKALTGDKLALLMGMTSLIHDWCLAIRTQVEAELYAGNHVPGWKIVQGRMGSRKWTDETEAENALKAMRLKQDEMYKMSLVSPTQAEKVLKSNPRKWNKLQELITQTQGQPSVAPESDKRPALQIQPSEDDFEVVDN